MVRIAVWIGLVGLAACEPGDGAGTGTGSGSGTGSGTGTGTGSGTGTGTGTGTGGSGCWQADQFPALTADPANGDWDAPTVVATCTDTELHVSSNGIPDFEFVPVTPNDLREQTWDWTVTLTPAVAGSTTDIPELGTVAFAVNGLVIYGPNEGPFPDPFGDPVYNGIVDFCLGHTAQNGDYHFHAMLEACVRKGFVRAADEPSPVLGFALDGFPIYGSWDCADADCTEVIEHVSGWEQTGDPTTYAWDNYDYVGGADPAILDRCNGHVGPQGDYHYHVTEGFPYILGCYAGDAP